MRKKELELAILHWSARATDESAYANHPVNVKRVYQLGLVVGLLASLCQHDFYAKQQVLKKLCLKD